MLVLKLSHPETKDKYMTMKRPRNRLTYAALSSSRPIGSNQETMNTAIRRQYEHSNQETMNTAIKETMNTASSGNEHSFNEYSNQETMKTESRGQ